MKIVFERDKLYEEVWTAPLTRLANKYGLSDNGLRKICKSMNIPLPKAGHWAKIAAGQRVEKTSLPKHADRTTFISSPPEPPASDDELSKDKAWCLKRESFEDQPENQIIVDFHPRRWHSAVIPLRDLHQKAAREYEGYRKHAERFVAKPASKSNRTWESSVSNDKWKWDTFVKRGMLLLDTHKAAPFRVSLLTYERALAIMNSFAWEAEKRGFVVSLNEDRGRIQIDGYEASVDIRLTERFDVRPDETQSPATRSIFRDVVKLPTGQLRIFVERYGHTSHEVADEPGAPLETRINAIFVKVYRNVVRAREQGRKWEERHRQHEIEEQRKAELEKYRREDARRAEEEKQRRAALVSDASNWQTAKLIREYVEYVLAHAGEPISDHLIDWKNWALDVASELDLTPAKRKGGEHV